MRGLELVASALSLKPSSFSKLEELVPNRRLSGREERLSFLRELLLNLEHEKLAKLLSEVLGIKEGQLLELTDYLKESHHIFITPLSPEYPRRLLILRDPPVLFVAGSLSLEELNGRLIGIVGTRRASEGTLQLARAISEHLSRTGAIIVSGFAVGVDAAAHEGALRAGGRTVGVLGCGLEVNYPRRNRSLRREMLKSGLLLSEYPPKAKPDKWRFPLRNRIIAALSEMVIVVGAPLRSGALITARIAAELSREVFALFREGDEHEGARELVRDGLAVPFSSLSDLLSALGEDQAETDEDIRVAILKLIEGGMRRTPEIVERLSERGYTSQEVLRALGELELKGVIYRTLRGFTNYERRY